MKTTTNTERKVYKDAHPFFAIDIDSNRVDYDLLARTLASLRDTYVVEFGGTVIEEGQFKIVITMFVWFYNPEHTYTLEDYCPTSLTYFLNKLGFEIDEEDVHLVAFYPVFGDRRCQCAPVIIFLPDFVLNHVSGNVNQAEYQRQLMEHNKNMNKSVFDHHISDNRNTDNQ